MKEFSKRIGTIDDTHNKIAQLNKHYSDYINKRGYFSLNVQAVSDYKYYFQNVVIKWLESLHDSHVSLVNKMLQKGAIPLCEKAQTLFQLTY